MHRPEAMRVAKEARNYPMLRETPDGKAELNLEGVAMFVEYVARYVQLIERQKAVEETKGLEDD